MTRVRRRLHFYAPLLRCFDERFAVVGIFEASISKINMIISILLAEMRSAGYGQTEVLQEGTQYMHLLISVANCKPHDEMMLSQTSDLCHLHYPKHRDPSCVATHVCHYCGLKLVRLVQQASAKPISRRSRQPTKLAYNTMQGKFKPCSSSIVDTFFTARHPPR